MSSEFSLSFPLVWWIFSRQSVTLKEVAQESSSSTPQVEIPKPLTKKESKKQNKS